MARYTTDALVESVLRKAFVTADQRTITEEEIAEIATEELNGFVVPQIRSAAADFFSYTQTYDVSDGEDGFEIPGRAAGSTISFIIGNQQGNAVCKIPLAQDGDLDTLILSSSNLLNFNTSSQVYFIRNNRIHLRPLANGTVDTITATFPARPNDLILEADARQILEINGNTITLTSALPSIDDTTPIDIIANNSPYVFRTYDVTPVSVVGADVELDELPVGIAVGDWVSLAGESAIPQIPYELHPVLRYRTLARVLEATGKQSMVPAALNSANELLTQLLPTIVPRVDRQHKAIVGSNPWIAEFSSDWYTPRRW